MTMFLEAIPISETMLAAGVSAVFGSLVAANVAQWRTLQRCQEARAEELRATVRAITAQAETMSAVAETLHGLTERFDALVA